MDDYLAKTTISPRRLSRQAEPLCRAGEKADLRVGPRCGEYDRRV